MTRIRRSTAAARSTTTTSPPVGSSSILRMWRTITTSIHFLLLLLTPLVLLGHNGIRDANAFLHPTATALSILPHSSTTCRTTNGSSPRFISRRDRRPSSFLPLSPSDLLEPIQSGLSSLPFQDVAKQLSQSLDIGTAFGQSQQQQQQAASEEATRLVLGSVGSDLLVFLTASVLVTTMANAVGITPILGYLVVGALLGPNGGLDMFRNTQAGVELGDFGILFLLFSEGLEVTTTRLYKLANYLPLGLAQISLTTGILTLTLLSVGRIYAGDYEKLLSGGFDDVISSLIVNIQDPIQACILAVTCALSTSAFIFPVLKERGWEEEQSGAAATTILLLQDLLVAPLLVILPIIVSVGPTDYNAIGYLTAKATLGFGSVIFVGSYLLRGLFRLVSQTRSSETFVALCLLVSVGMGEIARTLGLTDTAGAFAAGVLLANTNYRAQIQADILPFKGILLGIFFMDAGSNFDFGLVAREWPTVLGGSFALVLIKALTMAAATRVPKEVEPNRLPTVDAVRISILLSGGGEFAFVVLALAQKIDIFPQELIGLLTAIVLVTMGVTPLLGDLAGWVSRPFEEESINGVSENVPGTSLGGNANKLELAEDAILVLGHSEVGRATVRVLADLRAKLGVNATATEIVAFSRNPDLVEHVLVPAPGTVVLYGDGCNPNLIRSSGVTTPRAVFVTYQDHNRAMSATSRLRSAFPDAPIYVRAAKRRESRDLLLAGANEVIIEADELARCVPQLVQGAWGGPLALDTEYDEVEDYRRAAAEAAQLPVSVVDDLFDVYASLDLCATGLIGRDQVIDMFAKTKKGFVASDEEIAQMERWLKTTTAAHMDPMDRIEFCRLYARAPDFVQESFGRLPATSKTNNRSQWRKDTAD